MSVLVKWTRATSLALVLLMLCACASPSSRPGWEGQPNAQSKELVQKLAQTGDGQSVAVMTARVRGLREDILCVLTSSDRQDKKSIHALVYHIWGLRLVELDIEPNAWRVVDAKPMLFRVPNLDTRLAKAIQRSLLLRPDSQSGVSRENAGLQLRRKLPTGSAVQWSISTDGDIQSIEGLGSERFFVEWQGASKLPGLPKQINYRDPQDGFSVSISILDDQ